MGGLPGADRVLVLPQEMAEAPALFMQRWQISEGDCRIDPERTRRQAHVGEGASFTDTARDKTTCLHR
jgi:hypothetical protein